MENLDPPLPPQIKDGKMARFCPSRAFILDLGEGDGGLLFHFILSKIVPLKGSRVPAALPHLEIPKVPPREFSPDIVCQLSTPGVRNGYNFFTY